MIAAIAAGTAAVILTRRRRLRRAASMRKDDTDMGGLAVTVERRSGHSGRSSPHDKLVRSRCVPAVLGLGPRLPQWGIGFTQPKPWRPLDCLGRVYSPSCHPKSCPSPALQLPLAALADTGSGSTGAGSPFAAASQQGEALSASRRGSARLPTPEHLVLLERKASTGKAVVLLLLSCAFSIL